MLSYSPTPATFQFQHTLAPFLQDNASPFANVLTAIDVERAFADAKVSFGQTSRSFWTPASTLWALLGQVLSADPSCRQAVAQVVISFALSSKPKDLDTGGYCRARTQIPAKVLQLLACDSGRRLEEAAPKSWRWHGRRVLLVDGSTSTLPDSQKNRETFPQSKSQKPGLGYPIIRWVVLLGLATAALQGLAYGPYSGKETGETALFRQLFGLLEAGDIVVADRYYCSYFLVAALQVRNVDAVFRLHQKRKYDFRRGRRLGDGDHIVVWQRPPRPKWMSADDYQKVPETIEVREMRVTIATPGCRVRQLIVATTLRDEREYPREDVEDIYHKRWQAELDIRSLKTTLQMDALRCLSPSMVEKEIWANCLAYNLVRKVSAQAAVACGQTARSISFKASLQVVRGGWHKLTTTGDDYARLVRAVVASLRKERVGDRPDRCEPRLVKRRPKPYKNLREPRAAAKARLLGKKALRDKAKLTE